MMRKLTMPAIGSALACGLIGCGGENPEKLQADMVAIMKEFADVMESVKDEESGKAAQARLEGVAAKFKDLKKRAEGLKVSSEQKTKNDEKYGAEMSDAMERIRKAGPTCKKFGVKLTNEMLR